VVVRCFVSLCVVLKCRLKLNSVGVKFVAVSGGRAQRREKELC